MIQVAQILFILSVLVILHEFGHFFAAKAFKVRVEKFYLFMDAGFALVKKKIGETEWGIGWLPLGGYVKLSGMIDESMDAAQMLEPAKPYEFRSKPAWQRLIIMLGGIIVNLLLAWFIYTTMFVTVGQKYNATAKVQENGLSFGPVGLNAGFQNGDKIVSVDGELQPKFNRVVIDVLLSDEVIVNRNGKQVKLHLTHEQIKRILGTEGKGFIKPRTKLNLIYVDSLYANKIPLQVNDTLIGINNTPLQFVDQLNDSLRKNKNKTIDLLVVRGRQTVKVPFKVTEKYSHAIDSVAGLSGIVKFNNFHIAEVVSEANQNILKEGDQVVSVTGKNTQYYHELERALIAQKGGKVSLDIIREGKPMTVTAAVSNKGKLGIRFDQKKMDDEYLVTNHLSIGESVSAAIKESYVQFLYNIKQFKLILQPKTGAYAQVKSPVGIARQLPDTWDWEYIWNFTAMFSIGLAFMNLLPIPGLDGGHALFTLAEMITGRKLSDKAMGHVQTAGMIILLTLMALTFGKDIYQLIADKLFSK